MRVDKPSKSGRFKPQKGSSFSYIVCVGMNPRTRFSPVKGASAYSASVPPGHAPMFNK